VEAVADESVVFPVVESIEPGRAVGTAGEFVERDEEIKG
jgi:hypothetical protein